MTIQILKKALNNTNNSALQIWVFLKVQYDAKNILKSLKLQLDSLV